jgi:glycosyltransferase involved in cell wall biosynthesis
LKVLLATGIYPPEIGGPATFIPRFAQFLTEHAVEVEVLTFRSPLPEISPLGTWDVHVIRPSRFKAIRFWRVFKWLLTSGREFDAIFANGMHEEVGISSLFLNTQVVAKIVGDPIWERATNSGRTTMDIDSFNLRSPSDPILKIQRFLLKFSLNQYSKITAPSTTLVAQIKQWGVYRNVTYIPNGVETKNLPQKIKKVDLVAVSRIVKWKQLDLLIRSIAGTDLQLRVIGDGPELESLKVLSEDLGVQIEFCGQKSSHEIEELIMESSVFVQASSYEGQSFSLLKAMSLGIPSIVSPIKANLDVIEIGKSGMVFNEMNPTHMQRDLIALLANQELLKRLSDGAKKRVSEYFDEQKNFQKYLDLITDE